MAKMGKALPSKRPMVEFGIMERAIRSVLAISLCGTVVFLCFLCNIIQLVLLPATLASVRVKHYSSSLIVGSLWKLCNLVFYISGGQLQVFGSDEVRPGESAMVISNHRSFADFFLMHVVAIQHDMIWCCRYFVKDSIKWIPFFGWGMRLMGMIMLKRNWLQDQKRIFTTFAFYTKHRLPLWLVSYSEGSRFSARKQQECREYAVVNGRPPLTNVLLPRTRGFSASVLALKDTISAVYDFTLVFYARDGRQRVPAPWEYLFAGLNRYVFEVHVRRHALNKLPTDDEKQLGEWLHARFQDKDKLLQQRYEAIAESLL